MQGRPLGSASWHRCSADRIQRLLPREGRRISSFQSIPPPVLAGLLSWAACVLELCSDAWPRYDSAAQLTGVHACRACMRPCRYHRCSAFRAYVSALPSTWYHRATFARSMPAAQDRSCAAFIAINWGQKTCKSIQYAPRLDLAKILATGTPIAFMSMKARLVEVPTAQDRRFAAEVKFEQILLCSHSFISHPSSFRVGAYAIGWAC